MRNPKPSQAKFILERQGVIKTLESNVIDLTETEKQISTYILNNLWQIPELTISELSKLSKTSPSAITRFSRKIGCDGFQELKLKLSSEIALLPFLEDEDENKQKDIKTALTHIGSIIGESLEPYNQENIDPVLELLNEKEIIFVHGIGLSHLSALNVYQKFNRIGKICIPIVDLNIVRQSFFANPEKILYWGISNTGKSTEIVDTMRLVNELGISSITLTSSQPNPMTEMSDFPLFTTYISEEPSASNPSIYAQFAVIDYIFLMYFKKYNISMENPELD